jgi:PPM family protein phosphatase
MDTITWSSAGKTDVGLKRKDNQDNLFISPDERLFVVADGMGGVRDGALASKLAVGVATDCWESLTAGQPVQDIGTWLKQLVLAANQKILCSSKPNTPAGSGMGTTIVALYLTDDCHAHIAHVGDSRAYLVRDNHTQVITEDHTVVMEMYRRGQLTLQQCKTSQMRHLVSRCLGHDEGVEVDLTAITLAPGDWLLLASDGLAEGVDESEVAGLLSGCTSPETACESLVGATMAAGAPDNVTVIAIKTNKAGSSDEHHHQGDVDAARHAEMST